MSVVVTDTARLIELCEQALAVHTRPGHGWPGEKVTLVFRGIYLAQRAAYAMSYGDYGDEFDSDTVDFPTKAPSALILRRPDLGELYTELRMLRYNTVDQNGNSWLPDRLDGLLAELITETAALAADFRHT